MPIEELADLAAVSQKRADSLIVADSPMQYKV